MSPRGGGAGDRAGLIRAGLRAGSCGDCAPGLGEGAAVLEAIKPASRRLRRWPSARFFGWLRVVAWGGRPGRKNGAFFGRTEHWWFVEQDIVLQVSGNGPCTPAMGAMLAP